MASFRDTGFLLRQALRQAIWETLNRHRSSAVDDVALVGSRRSGSTLLMQIIAHQPRMKSIDQPFALPTATSAQMRHLGWPPGGVLTSDDSETRSRVLSYVEALQDGRLHVQEPWRFWRKDFHFRTDRLVLKTTGAGFLLDALADAGLKIVLYFRHPGAQALSCKRNGWGDKLGIFAESRTITDKYLNDDQRRLLSELELLEPCSLERYVMAWCIENQPLFAALANGTPPIFYEDLVMHPDETLDRLTDLCGLDKVDAMRAMLRQPSVSTKGLSEKSTANAIRAGSTTALVGRWIKEVDEAMLGRLQRILDQFPGCPYRMDSLTKLPQFCDSPRENLSCE